jgi:MFS family permease
MSISTESPSVPALDRPRDLLVARVPVFYGWVMLPAAMIAQVVTSPGQSFAIAVFNQSFTETFRLTEKQLTGAFGLGTLLASVALPFFGALMDRWGIRKAMSLAVFLLGAACLFASQVQGLVSLFVAFLLLRMFGQGALSLFALNTVAMWFRRRLGTAAGIMSVGCVLLMGQVPPTIRLLLNEFGWRWAYAILGLTVWAIMVPILLFVYRSRPEDIGQRPDGDKPDSHDAESGDPSNRSRNLSAAMRTRAYWVMFSVQAIWAMSVTALIFNIQKVFLSAGHEVIAADLSITWFFYAIAAMHLVGGVLADRFPLNWLLTVSVAAMASSISILLFGGASFTWLGYVVMGLAQGLLGAVANTLWARFYGRDHVGKIRGSIATAMVAGSALGPFLMGFSHDTFGSYTPSLWLFLGLFGALTLMVPLATPPRMVADRSAIVADGR